MNEDSSDEKINLFDFYVKEAEHPFSGWDFSYIEDRMVTAPFTWSYSSKILPAIRQVESVLDMGTGGGEFFSSLKPLPKISYATESYGPNFPIAQKRLEPLGAKVVKPENDENLPFDENFFDLIINRHEYYSESEVYRILKKKGLFITQQVGGTNDNTLRMLLTGNEGGNYTDWNVDLAIKKLQDAGLVILEKDECFPITRFFDIGTIVYYLLAVPWEVPDFTVKKYENQLRKIHSSILKTGYLEVKSHRFFIKATKP
jgi:SAM-dependent methyltransferase